MNNSDPEQRAMEIENFVASNDLNSAARRLMDFVTDFSQNRIRKREVIDIRAKYTDLREDLRIYRKTDEIYNRQIQLRNQILSCSAFK